MKTTILSRSTRWMILAAALGTVAVSPLTATPQQAPEGAAEISSFIKMDVKADRQLTGSSITASTAKGIVTLEGSALSIDQSERAAARAMATHGVRAVINHVRIIQPVASDDVVGERAERALAKSPALDAAKVKVRVQDRHAMISGEVGTWDEQELARAIVAEVPGIREIDNRLAVNFDTIRSESAIRAQIQHLVKHDPLYDGVRVDVAVKEGVVSIAGEVGSRAEKERLIRQAHVTGVMEVKGEDIVVNSDLAMEGLTDKNFSQADTLAALNDALAADSRVQGSRINPSLSEGIVTLAGSTPSSQARTAAESTARGLPGVVGVSNELIILGETGDAATAANITSALKKDQTLAYLGLSADCKNGLCTIGGQAFSNDEKSRAAILAAAIPGVKSLKNEIVVDSRAAAVRDDKTSPDARIADGIRKQLFWTPGVNSKEVQVSVNKGKALLSGTVSSRKTADTVVKNAYKGGAHEVDNRMAVTDK